MLLISFFSIKICRFIHNPVVGFYWWIRLLNLVGHKGIVKLLIEYGADLDARDSSGKTAYDVALYNSNNQTFWAFNKQFNLSFYFVFAKVTKNFRKNLQKLRQETTEGFVYILDRNSEKDVQRCQNTMITHKWTIYTINWRFH